MDHWRNQIKEIPRNKLKQKHSDEKVMKRSKIYSKREVYSNTSLSFLSKEIIKISNKQLNFTPKATRKEIQAKPKLNRRKSNHRYLSGNKCIRN